VKTFTWDTQKNEHLQRERGVSFEAIVVALSADGLLAVQEHPNPRKYPGQRIFVVELQGYAHLVPFRETKAEIKLITIIPSRKTTKVYSKPGE
jgi:uncharacterized DUF497 family protein